MARRFYSSTAQPMSVTGTIGPSDLIIAINSVSGLPSSTPFTLVLDPGTSAEEIITVNAVAGLSLTVIRGEDGTAAQTHLPGAQVRHKATARDLREPQVHIDSATNVHGLGPTDSVVGTGKTQTLTSKSLSGTDNTFTNIPQSAVTGLTTALTAEQTARAAADTAEAATRAAADTAEQTARTSAIAAAVLLASPPGVMTPYAGTTAPTGWLICDGTAVSRTTYAALFTAIGTTYGVGNGTTTFTLPNTKGRVVVGLDAAQSEFNVLGETGGAKTHTLTEAEMPAHNHTATTASAGTHNHSGGQTVFFADQFTSGRTAGPGSDGALVVASTQQASAGAHTHTVTVADAGSGTAHSILQPYIAVNHIIKT